VNEIKEGIGPYLCSIEWELAVNRLEHLRRTATTKKKTSPTAGFTPAPNLVTPTLSALPVLEQRMTQGYECIVFGSYAVDDATKHTPIEWLVLKRESGRMLLLSRYILDYKPYGGASGAELHLWLNSEFLYRAFNEEQRAQIMNLKHSAQEFKKIFLLSKSAIENYFPTKQERIAYAANANDRQRLKTGAVCWWLRDDSVMKVHPSCVQTDGTILTWYDRVSAGIRPAMWLRDTGM
jgi:hypothetical protein